MPGAPVVPKLPHQHSRLTRAVSGLTTTPLLRTVPRHPIGSPVLHASTPADESPPPQGSVWRSYHGGVRPAAVDGPGVYYLGIVDMLQRYTWKKRGETAFKSLFKPRAGQCNSPRKIRDR